MSDPKQTALKSKITRLRNQSKAASLTLAQKLKIKEQVKVAEQELHEYRLALAAEKDEAKALPKRKKLVAKAFDEVARNITREQLREACRKPPAAFQDWGYIRTQAWVKLAGHANRLVKRVRPNTEEMACTLRQLRDVPNITIERCQQLATPKSKSF